MAIQFFCSRQDAQLTAGSMCMRIGGYVLGLCLLWGLQGCVSSWIRLTQAAEKAGVKQHSLPGAGFTHTMFVKAAAGDASSPVVVFIEGDGMPWRNHGWQPNPDPRPHRALAFNLFVQTPGPAWYLTRPCYDDSLATSACTATVWTDARYSAANVTSMVTALRHFAAEQHVQQLVLVGYSGGGALAVLIAAQMREVSGVVTIAANLDQVAWAQVHRYSPLTGSLNPATDTHGLVARHVALHGVRDSNVPVQTLAAFVDTHPATQWWHVQDYDHVCCWERDWPSLWPQLQLKLREN